MMIRVSTYDEAMMIAKNFITGFGVHYDYVRSTGAGYDIYAGDEDSSEYICDLGDRLEVNLPADRGGMSYNIWIDGKKIAELAKKMDAEKRETDALKEQIKEYKIFAGEIKTFSEKMIAEHSDDTEGFDYSFAYLVRALMRYELEYEDYKERA